MPSWVLTARKWRMRLCRQRGYVPSGGQYLVAPCTAAFFVLLPIYLSARLTTIHVTHLNILWAVRCAYLMLIITISERH